MPSCKLEMILYEGDEIQYQAVAATDASLNKRAFYKPESVEDTVIHKLQDESLHKAIAELPKTQRRRLQLYYFGGLTYGQIAEMEGCKYQAVQDSIYTALNTLKNYFSK